MTPPPPPSEEGPADRLEAQLEAVPPRPGVYLLKDASGGVLYVGKAKSLRARVQSYFRGGDGRYQIEFLVRKIEDVECLVTRNEKEALILENNLIKQYKPRYNVRLKDDKSYVSVKITSRDEWPRVLVTRKIVKDGSRYFGPFHSASAVRGTIDVIRKVFPLRTCSDAVFRNRSRPCLEYQIKRCLAPCVLPVDRQDYEGHLRSAALLLQGRDSQLTRLLEDRMARASEDLHFEEAARLRDQLKAIATTGERQQVVAHAGVDQDVFGLYREGGFIEVQVLIVRAGRLTANQSFGFGDWEFPDDEVLGAMLTQFYQGNRAVAREVLLPVGLEDHAARVELLRERRDGAVEILVPQRGAKRALVELATQNAQQAFFERRDAQERLAHTADELQRRLHLRSAPKRLECVDISTFQGGETVGSVVAFDEGRPDTSRYRRYRIKTVVGTDDFASMREMLTRRLSAGLRRDDLPDLLVIDGGRGQLGIALAVCSELGVEGLDVVGLAKARALSDAQASEVQRVEERVFLPGRTNPVVLARNSNALFLLQQVRDEAHRFAVTYHKKLRDRARLRSPLDEIVGVGATRRKAILRHFGSVARVRAASVEDVAAVPGIGRALAETVKAALEGM
ncbi:MAG: excinuclease ABC subunit UvrC [Candidatus Binatia bacterium]|nr:excinuclease ABC subunit UvrC [Candidatus Binatia bacterium]